MLREAGLITGERRGTWVYYRVRPDALRQVSAVVALAPGPRMTAAPEVLFVCVHNAGRSQMAAALLAPPRRRAGCG